MDNKVKQQIDGMSLGYMEKMWKYFIEAEHDFESIWRIPENRAYFRNSMLVKKAHQENDL